MFTSCASGRLPANSRRGSRPSSWLAPEACHDAKWDTRTIRPQAHRIGTCGGQVRALTKTWTGERMAATASCTAVVQCMLVVQRIGLRATTVELCTVTPSRVVYPCLFAVPRDARSAHRSQRRATVAAVPTFRSERVRVGITQPSVLTISTVIGCPVNGMDRCPLSGYCGKWSGGTILPSAAPACDQ